MIHILRLGHRRQRDARLTTHVCLAARALGADGITIAEKDAALERTVKDVVDRFGGGFSIESGVSWKPFVKRWKREGGTILHLTMYGEPLSSVVPKIPAGNILIVVGAEKVPREIYDLADFNVAAGNQPHSEVAALALLLDRVTRGAWEAKTFEGPLNIVANPRGKTLINRSGSPSSRTRGGNT